MLNLKNLHVSAITAMLLAAPALAQAAPAAHAAAPGGHEVAESTGGAALLSPEPGTAIWTLILFIILVFVLGKFVWPSVVKGLEAREEKIRKDLSDASAANAAAQSTLADYQRKLADAHAEARKLVDQARKDGEALRHRMVGETEAEIARIRHRATEEISQARQQAVQQLYATAADLSVAVAEKILQRQINEPDTARLVEQSLSQLDQLKAS